MANLAVGGQKTRSRVFVRVNVLKDRSNIFFTILFLIGTQVVRLPVVVQLVPSLPNSARKELSVRSVVLDSTKSSAL